MTQFSFVFVFIASGCLDMGLTAEYTAKYNNIQGNIEKTVARGYSISTCDYRSQFGYSCLGCHRALHCYPGNIAIIVDCYGMLRNCRDGRCSRYQDEKCLAGTTPNSNTADASSLSEKTTEPITEAITEEPTDSAAQADPAATTESVHAKETTEPTIEAITNTATVSTETSVSTQ